MTRLWPIASAATRPHSSGLGRRIFILPHLFHLFLQLVDLDLLIIDMFLLFSSYFFWVLQAVDYLLVIKLQVFVLHVKLVIKFQLSFQMKHESFQLSVAFYEINGFLVIEILFYVWKVVIHVPLWLLGLLMGEYNRVNTRLLSTRVLFWGRFLFWQLRVKVVVQIMIQRRFTATWPKLHWFPDS